MIVDPDRADLIEIDEAREELARGGRFAAPPDTRNRQH